MLRRAAEPVPRIALTAGLLAVLAACSPSQSEKPAPQASETPPPAACESAQFEGTPLTHCTARTGLNRIVTVLGPAGGKPYRSLSELALARSHAQGGKAQPAVAFAMNAGMFDTQGLPIGYYVENGKRGHELNTNEGWGNFHLKPNGVFYGAANGPWAIRTSDDFQAHVSSRPDFGTQSGPMLVIGGKLHPKLDSDGASLKLRNAVGVDDKGNAHFVIADAPVSFGRLARYFRDVLHCRNALFLDGSVSSLWDPEHGRVDGGPALGPLIVVEKRTKAKP
ncbi:phosphodiester glycosidase family protein [Novosphingobium sp. 9]|uniref:phosphodiester glycosidase family protein n=1 Tax=Novosphingobium sp. 9 TaxID=2025349 RepID=UPI0021B4F239|nr:phosphodiester glycosidase family protein [Novosphingobium sp. 9]